MKRRLDVDTHGIRRRTQQVGVIVARAEGRREQGGAAGSAQARPDEARGHNVAQTQLREVALAVEVAFADVEQVLLVKKFGHPIELQYLEVKALQCTVQSLRMIVKVIADAGAARRQGLEQFFRWLVIGLISSRLLVMQGVPFAVDSLQA